MMTDAALTRWAEAKRVTHPGLADAVLRLLKRLENQAGIIAASRDTPAEVETPITVGASRDATEDELAAWEAAGRPYPPPWVVPKVAGRCEQPPPGGS